MYKSKWNEWRPFCSGLSWPKTFGARTLRERMATKRLRGSTVTEQLERPRNGCLRVSDSHSCNGYVPHMQSPPTNWFTDEQIWMCWQWRVLSSKHGHMHQIRRVGKQQEDMFEVIVKACQRTKHYNIAPDNHDVDRQKLAWDGLTLPNIMHTYVYKYL